MQARGERAEPQCYRRLDVHDTVTIHGDEWKWSDIRDEVEWCRTRTWERKHWAAREQAQATARISPHNHCRICWWTLADSSDPAVNIGYHAGRDIWLCSECYDKFIAVPNA